MTRFQLEQEDHDDVLAKEIGTTDPGGGIYAPPRSPIR